MSRRKMAVVDVAALRGLEISPEVVKALRELPEARNLRARAIDYGIKRNNVQRSRLDAVDAGLKRLERSEAALYEAAKALVASILEALQ